MTCMKCGVEIPETQVFCDHCLEVMDRYPVKPDAHVHLPKHQPTEDPSRKAVKKKRDPSLEEQLAAVKLQVLRLRLAVVVLLFVLCLLGGFLGLNLYQQYNAPAPGFNYTIDTTMGK